MPEQHAYGVVVSVLLVTCLDSPWRALPQAQHAAVYMCGLSTSQLYVGCVIGVIFTYKFGMLRVCVKCMYYITPTNFLAHHSYAL